MKTRMTIIPLIVIAFITILFPISPIQSAKKEEPIFFKRHMHLTPPILRKPLCNIELPIGGPVVHFYA